MQISTRNRASCMNASRITRLFKMWWVPFCLLFVAACHSDMYRQARLEPYGEAPREVFANGSAMQESPANTVARGNLRTDEAYFTGLENGQEIAEIPVEVTAAMLQQGKLQYDIYCVPCHGAQGNGRGVVSALFQKWPPASLISGTLLTVPSGHFYNVITNGVVRKDDAGKDFQSMYSYASRIAPEDRWAIAAYIRALQKDNQNPLGVAPDQIK